MKGIKTATALTAAAVLAIAGCGGSSTNVTVNSAGNANRSTSAINSGTNTVANAVNSVANTVSNAAASVTTPSADSFMRDAAHGGMAEVELGKLAATKGQNAEVKSFGKMMDSDHSKANAELKALAAKKNVPLPTDLGPHASTVEKLKGMSGADFDREYVNAMVEDHEEDVAAFQKQADNATDPEVKAFAAKTLPTLKKHLEMIQAIQSKMNNQPTAADKTAANKTPANK
jgi:putative membrane protein